jgi:dihydrofolate reductase
MKAFIVVANSLNHCIGANNTLPWNLPKDMKRFKTLTSSGEQNIVIMGRKTFESIGKPLPNRINYVLTKDLKTAKKIPATTFSSLEDAIADIEWWENFLDIEYNVYVIGGSSVFNEAIEKGYVNTIYHTLIHENIDGDTFLELPDWNISEEEIVMPDEKNKSQMTFRTLTRP